MSLEVLQNLALNHIILGNLITFVLMIVTNIFPIMIFIYPDIAIFLWVFIAKEITIWYIPYIILIIWAFIWEFISYLIWYRYWHKILEHRFLKKNIAKKWIEKLKQKPIKTLIIWKLLPWIVWIIPILSGALKTNPVKFTIVDLIMIIYSISLMFLVRLIWISFLERYLWKHIRYIVFIGIILYVFYHIYKIIKNNWIKE